MDLSDSRRPENLLTITPIVAWRRWVVSYRRPWEEGSGAVLRGAWGRAWTTARLEARCLRPPTGSDVMGGFLSNLEAGHHSTPAPEPACACGIYAEKPDSIDLTRNPRLTGRPAVAGFVGLSGRVLEGTKGFRASAADIVGPLELQVPCGGVPSADPLLCPQQVTTVFIRGEEVRGACGEHGTSASDAANSALANWVDRVIAQLQAAYAIPIIYLD